MISPSASEDLFYTRCPVPTALAVALETGLIDEEFSADGFRVRSLASSPLATVRDAHYTHAHPRLLRQGGNIPPLMAADRGHDLKIVGLSWAEVSLPVLVLPESGIRAAGDLAGRRLPLPRRSGVSIDCWEPAILRGYERTLAAAGLTLDDVELVPIEIERTFNTPRFTAPGATEPLWDREFILGLQREEVLALLRGEVDAIFSESSIAEAVTSMFGVVRVSDLRDLEDPSAKVTLPLPVAISVSQPLIEQDPFLVTRWLAVLKRAARRADESPEEARRILAAEVSIPVDALDRALAPDVTCHLDVDLAPGHLAALESQAAFLFDHGYTERPVELETLIDPRPLAAAQDLAFDPSPTREIPIPG
jgi:ABC-type nitrate/sulfonate/bicarbonate transport system substrate-binding protein